MVHKNNFDVLRLLAACQVVFMHAGEHLRLPYGTTTGYVLAIFPGVPIFFVISGFLVTASLVNSESAPHYFTKRALRIYPAMWVNIAVIIIMMFAAGVFRDPAASFAWLLIVALTGSTIFAEVAGTAQFVWNESLRFFPGGVLATITMELGFYIVAPLLFHRRIRSNPPVLCLVIVAAGAASIAVQVHLQNDENRYLWTTIPPYLWIFLLGSAAWFAWSKLRFLFDGTAALWIPVYLSYSLWSGQIPDYHNLNLLNALQLVLLAGTVLSAAHTLPRASTFLRGNDISYGVYLYHMPVIVALMSVGLERSAYLLIVVYALTFLAAVLSWLLVEKPCLAKKQSMLLRSPAAVFAK
ncbi:peptidoglycan/LPS O-acetylase OafA/YrhL [Bradyrhizobium sp. LB8.2]|uniref:acyltransferase family protein n=1 Tax=unclassified Bradyrhizobium TaxID=2631580 RepID=UPI0033984F29